MTKDPVLQWMDQTYLALIEKGYSPGAAAEMTREALIVRWLSVNSCEKAVELAQTFTESNDAS